MWGNAFGNAFNQFNQGGNSPHTSPGNFDFGAIPGLMNQAGEHLGAAGGFLGGMAGSGSAALGALGGMAGGMGQDALRGLGGAASSALGGLGNAFGGLGGIGSSMMGGLGSAFGGLGGLGGAGLKAMGGMGGLGLKALGALGPVGGLAGGLLGGMLKQGTWSPTDVITNKLGGFADKLSASRSPFAKGLGKTIDSASNLLGNIAGSKGVAGKMWDSSIGAIGKGIGKLFSDAKLKENVQYIGKSPMGINVYEFDYKDKSYGSGRYRGVMAHEVPWAAERANNGYLRVDYSKVDVNFTTANK